MELGRSAELDLGSNRVSDDNLSFKNNYIGPTGGHLKSNFH